MARLKEEDLMQIQVFNWIKKMGLDDFIFHPANERKCSLRAGALLKSKGVKSGVSDIIILKASKGFHGALIELKTEKGRLSVNQKSFLDTMKLSGYFTSVCRSAREAKSTISHYLNLNIIPLRTPPLEPAQDFQGEF
jgi:hypothetical protein